MNNAWKDYVALVMSKEMLVESGDAESNVIFNSLSWQEDSPFNHSTNVLFPSIKTDNKIFKGIWNLAGDPVDNRFLHYSGKITGPFGSVCKSFEVVVNGERQRISINDRTKLQKNYFTESEELHIFAEKEKDGITARYVLTDGAVTAIQYYHDTTLGAAIIESFLKLSSPKQAAYGMLATNKSLRRTVLYALAYLSTKAIMDQSFSVDTIRRAVDTFNSTVCTKINCDKIKPSLLSLYAQDLFGNQQTDLSPDDFFQQIAFSFNKTKKLLPLSFFAIIGCFSAWHEKKLSTAQIIVEKLTANRCHMVTEALSTMAHPKLVDAVLRELLEALPNYPNHADTFNSIFFEVLKRCNCLSDDMICRLSRVLFRDTIYQDQAQNMYDVLCGPNGEHFRNYITNSYRNACEEGIAAFHFCAAAIANAERHHASQNALEAAIDGIAKANTSHDYLLNVMCLGLLAWDGRIGRGNYTAKIRELALDNETISKFISYLSIPDKLFFPIIACTVHDLSLADTLDPGILGEPQRLAALQALEDEDIRRRAEELLSLIKVPDTAQATGSHTESLRKKYMDRYEACHQDPKSNEDCEVLLAVLCHLGSFPTLAEKRDQLDRVLLRSFASKTHTYTCNKWRIGHLARSVCLCPHLWGICTTNIDPITLGQELTEERKQELISLSNKIAKEDRQYRVTDTQEAVDIIKFIAPYTYDISTQKHPVATNLGKYIVMEVPNPGSFIISNWFTILCRYANPEQALDYYRTYRKILDRPVNMLSGCSYNGERRLYEAYKAYTKGKKRVCEGLHASVTSGNLRILAAFMNSEFRSLVDNQTFVDSFITDDRISGIEEELVSIYDGRFGTDSALKAAKGQSCATTNNSIEILIDKVDRIIEGLQSPLEAFRQEPTDLLGQSHSCITPDSSPVSSNLEGSSLKRIIHPELDLSPTRYYDDLTVQCYTLLKKPGQAHLVMMIGYGDDYDLMKYAVSVNGPSLEYASKRIQEDNEICLIALQQTGLALPYVKGSIREDTKTVTPLLLASECVLGGIPQQYCENPDVVMKAVLRDPTQLQYASETLRSNRDIVAAAISQEQRKDKVPSVIKWASEELRDDKDLMIRALKANPQAYSYLSPRLRKDPDILAIDHVDKWIDRDELMAAIQKIIDSLS